MATPTDLKIIADMENTFVRSMLNVRLKYLYNGKPTLCRKCAMLWTRQVDCPRGGKCELESDHAAETRQLDEVHRRLKANFSGQPDPYDDYRHQTWQALVGASQRTFTP